MATAALEPKLACLTEWTDQQQRYEADLQESFDALDAYQRQLDAWQRRLAAEREQLEQERSRLQEQAESADHGDRTSDLEAELNASQQRVAELQTQLADGGSAAPELQSENARLAAEADQARQDREELKRQLEESQAELEQQKQHWSNELSRVAKQLEERQAVSAPPPAYSEPAAGNGSPAAAGDPVLGSVVAQFSKLRQQRAERGLR